MLFVRCICIIPQYITTEALKIFVQELVISRLDYSNALLYGIYLSLVCRL